MTGRPFKWTVSDGVAVLQALPGQSIGGSATAASYDGSVIVGVTETFSPQTFGAEAFRWTAETGKLGLGHLPTGGTNSSAAGISGDGTRIVGHSDFVANDERQSGAVLWSLGNPILQIGFNDDSGALDISADGKLVVGAAEVDGIHQAIRWTAEGGLLGLGDLPGGLFGSNALGVSADGTVVVGRASSDESGLGHEAFRWSAATGMVGLGDLPGGVFHSDAWAVSADGKTIVGASSTGTPLHYLGLEAAIWDPQHGIRRLQDVLEDDFGLDLTGWTLEIANDISWDGLTIVGYGTNPAGQTEAFVAKLDYAVPEPATLTLIVIGAAIVSLATKRRQSRTD